MDHHHIVPTGGPPQAQGYESAHTARAYGRKWYGARKYRLIGCFAACPVWPPQVLEPQRHAKSGEGNDGREG